MWLGWSKMNGSMEVQVVQKSMHTKWNTSKVASTLGYLKRLLGPLGKWREGIECYGPTSGTTHLTDSVNFPLLILSNHFRLWTVRRFSMRTHLSHALHYFTNTRFPHGESSSIKLNLILDSSFLCYVWLCCHTHAHHTCFMLLFHSATTMQLHHAFNLRYACLRQYW